MSESNDGVHPMDATTFTDDALAAEIVSNQRTERRLLVVVGLVATAATVVVLILHGPIS
jgi:hypothetical protein